MAALYSNKSGGCCLTHVDTEGSGIAPRRQGVLRFYRTGLVPVTVNPSGLSPAVADETAADTSTHIKRKNSGAAVSCVPRE